MPMPRARTPSCSSWLQKEWCKDKDDLFSVLKKTVRLGACCAASAGWEHNEGRTLSAEQAACWNLLLLLLLRPWPPPRHPTLAAIHAGCRCWTRTLWRAPPL